MAHKIDLQVARGQKNKTIVREFTPRANYALRKKGTAMDEVREFNFGIKFLAGQTEEATTSTI